MGRMARGRVWHVLMDGAALCGKQGEATETLVNLIPDGGRFCRECLVWANEWRNLVLGIATKDALLRDTWNGLLDSSDDEEPDD